MMTGEVTPDKEAIVRLIVRGPGGQEERVSAVLDTGYTEYLTLPPVTIAALGLLYQYSVPMYLADGSPIRVRVYDAIIVWNGVERSIPVQETDGDVLLGMSLLYGSRLLVDVVDGGQVAIHDIP
jgi:clan AA aspartic protease